MKGARWLVLALRASALLGCLVLAGYAADNARSADSEPSKAESNKQQGEQFLAANAKKPGVKTTASGLQYLVLKEGTGKKPEPGDTVVVHYHGTLIDGTVFDSSVDRGEPASFRVNRVIRGWTEALQLMKEGSKWRVFIPSKLAYRQRAIPPKIGPNETLIFEIELLEVK
jgi:FKBP-type peptidyl-prolyl cis-trans isomerase FklB